MVIPDFEALLQHVQGLIFTPSTVSSVFVQMNPLRNCNLYAMIQENVGGATLPPVSQMIPHPVTIGYCQGPERSKRAKQLATKMYMVIGERQPG